LMVTSHLRRANGWGEMLVMVACNLMIGQVHSGPSGHEPVERLR
jgi:hypothetical protein